jgi:hypothetical protein
MADVCPPDPAAPRDSAQAVSVPQPAPSNAIAHDFNNILGAMIGWIHLARRQSTDPAIDALLERALAAGERGKRLTLRLVAHPCSDDQATLPVDAAALPRTDRLP